MAGELLHALPDIISTGMLSEAGNTAHEGASQVKALALGAGSTAALVGGMMIRNRLSKSQEGITKDGRVRFVDQGWIGLRERNRQFYRNIPMYDGFNPGSDPMYWHKEFYDLMLPGFMIAPHPWRKYKLLNTQNDNRDFHFVDTQVPDKQGRLFNVGGGFTWGHITGVDENRQLKQYSYLNSSPTHDAGPVRVEQLVFNGIMAGKGNGATDVGDQIRTIVKPVVYDLLYEAKDPVKKARRIFEIVERKTHDAMLDLGAELRVVEPIVSPHIFGHLAMQGVDIGRQLDLAAMNGMRHNEHSGVGFTTAPAAIM